jgi:hypothetical protein
MLFSIKTAKWSSRRSPFARSGCASLLLRRSNSPYVNVSPLPTMITAG